MKAAAGRVFRKRSSTVKPQMCRQMLLTILLLCIFSILPYWTYFKHNTVYQLLFDGINFKDHNANAHYQKMPNSFLNNTSFEDQYDYHDHNHSLGSLIAEDFERNRSLIGSGSVENSGGREDFVVFDEKARHPQKCATVEEMGSAFASHADEVAEASLKVRKMIQQHFSINGARRIRELPPDQFCRQNFVFGRTSEAGFGNEMYKILTAAALSLLLNRSLIMGEDRAKHSFGDYISYSNQTFSLKELKLLWVRNKCVGKYKRPLVMRIDDFEMPTRTRVLCEDWRKWKQPIVWFKGTTDTFGIQFFLKNIHPGMRDAASVLLGDSSIPSSRPNLFGELMKVLISPAHAIEEAVSWALNGGPDPDIALHMRMRVRRSRRALDAAIRCTERSLLELSPKNKRPRVVLVTDTPSIAEYIKKNLKESSEVIHFNYKLYTSQNASGITNATFLQLPQMRVKDWGPTPRWVAFVDFFLASRATHAVVSGAHKRVATTYAQLIAGVAAANKLDNTLASPLNFSFYSSFQSTLLVAGLSNQIGWGHAWNRFGGQLSCHRQINQCALTPLLPPGWWDGPWQSPITRDIHRLNNYGVQLTETGELSERSILELCKSRKVPVNVVTLELPSCKKCIKN